jgi:hypothetical protein
MAWNDDVDEVEELEELERCGALVEHRKRKHEELMKVLVRPTKKLGIITTTNMEQKLKEAKRKKREIRIKDIKTKEKKRKAALIRKYKKLLKEIKGLEMEVFNERRKT